LTTTETTLPELELLTPELELPAPELELVLLDAPLLEVELALGGALEPPPQPPNRVATRTIDKIERWLNILLPMPSVWRQDCVERSR
jgi:hypothetical protein